MKQMAFGYAATSIT